MATLKRQLRETAIQAMYMCDSVTDWSADSVRECLKNFLETEELVEPTVSLVSEIVSQLSDIDYKITRASRRWSVARMARLDRSILRVAVYELTTSGQVSLGITINESLELGRKYGSEESPQFINGILDRVALNEGLKPVTEIVEKTGVVSLVVETISPELVPVK